MEPGRSIQIQTPAPAKIAKVAKARPAAPASHCQAALDALERRCPDLIDSERWRQAVRDGRQFLAAWGEQAHADRQIRRNASQVGEQFRALRSCDNGCTQRRTRVIGGSAAAASETVRGPA
jgi:hypothetical protein